MEHREKPTVLLVDDSVSYFDKIKENFEAEGAKVSSVNSFEKALAFIHEDEGQRISIFVGEKCNGINALLSYTKNAVRHRVMTYVLANSPSRDLKIAWRRAGAYSVFDVRIFEIEKFITEGESKITAEYWEVLREITSNLARKTLDDISAEANNSLAWLLLKLDSEDHLTGLDNPRGFFHAVVPQLITMRDRSKEDYENWGALIALDADDFKMVNDVYGHLAGTEAIKFIARAIYEHVRPSDIVCRYGGDEFLVWLPGVTKAQAIPIGKKLEQVIADSDFSFDKKRIPLAISTGAAEVWRYEIGDPDEALNELIKKADVELYRAKDEKKNDKSKITS